MKEVIGCVIIGIMIGILALFFTEEVHHEQK